MRTGPADRDDNPWLMLNEEAQAQYFAERYGLAADQITLRAKLEAAARRVMD
jgi:hypothetical protein